MVAAWGARAAETRSDFTEGSYVRLSDFVSLNSRHLDRRRLEGEDFVARRVGVAVEVDQNVHPVLVDPRC